MSPPRAVGSLTDVDYETLQCTVDADGVALLTLSRPEQLNAFSVTMARELEQFFAVDAYENKIHIELSQLDPDYANPEPRTELESDEVDRLQGKDRVPWGFM